MKYLNYARSFFALVMCCAGGATININKNHADFDLNDDLGFEAADLVLDTAIVFPATNTPSEAIFTQKWASVSSQFDSEIFTCYR